MERDTATTIFESLSSGVRLDAFRLLVRKGAKGLVAGNIADALNVPPSNLSFHLKALTHARLLSVEQEGRFQRYRANTALMMDLVAYLTEKCCSESLDQCPGAPAASMCSEVVQPSMALAPGKSCPMNILSMGQVHPRSLALLAREGIATEGYTSTFFALPLAHLEAEFD